MQAKIGLMRMRAVLQLCLHLKHFLFQPIMLFMYSVGLFHHQTIQITLKDFEVALAIGKL